MQKALLSGGLTGKKSGYFTGVVLLAGLAALIYSTFVISKKSCCSYDRILTAAIGFFFTLKMVFNLGMIFGLLPINFLVIPFVSYGELGTVTNLIMAGLKCQVRQNVKSIRCMLLNTHFQAE